MSSIIIKGMEMPKDIEMLVVFSNGTVHKCLPGIREYLEKGTAVPVPDGVDLIDRKALMDDIIGSMVFSGREVPKEVAIVRKVLDIIGDANAIIPEEEEEQE